MPPSDILSKIEACKSELSVPSGPSRHSVTQLVAAAEELRTENRECTVASILAANQLDGAQKELKTTQHKLSDCEKQMASFKQNQHAFLARVKADNDLEKANLARIIDRLDQTVTRLDRSNSVLTETVARLGQSQSDLTKKNDDLTKTNDDLTKKVADLSQLQESSRPMRNDWAATTIRDCIYTSQSIVSDLLVHHLHLSLAPKAVVTRVYDLVATTPSSGSGASSSASATPSKPPLSPEVRERVMAFLGEHDLNEFLGTELKSIMTLGHDVVHREEQLNRDQAHRSLPHLVGVLNTLKLLDIDEALVVIVDDLVKLFTRAHKAFSPGE